MELELLSDINSWVAEDANGKQYFYKNEPELGSLLVWNAKSELCLILDTLFRRLDLGSNWETSKRRMISDRAIQKLSVDTLVMVRYNSTCEWFPRYLREITKEGYADVFTGWCTSMTGSDNAVYKEWKVYND